MLRDQEPEGRPSDESSSSSDEEAEREAWREVARMRRRKMGREREEVSTEDAGREGERVEMVAMPVGGRVERQRPVISK